MVYILNIYSSTELVHNFLPKPATCDMQRPQVPLVAAIQGGKARYYRGWGIGGRAAGGRGAGGRGARAWAWFNTWAWAASS